MSDEKSKALAAALAQIEKKLRQRLHHENGRQPTGRKP